MDEKGPATLLNIAIQSLLSNEPAAIHALEEIPRELFVPLFTAAFKGGHKNILTAMVKVWPYYCLHIGTLRVQELNCELLKAVIDSLQFLPVQNSASWSPKLRILDLRQDTDRRITCPEITPNSPFCFHSCVYSEHSILKIEIQHSIINSKHMTQFSRQPMELIVDLSLNGTLMEREFLSLLMSKVEESSGFLHVCCRDLQVDKLSDCKRTLKFLDLKCVDQLAVDQSSLSDITALLSQMIHLESLSLFKITFRSLKEKVFKTFLTHLRRMNNLKELNLSSFCLKDHLKKVLRVLPPDLDFLYLPFCELSYKDFKFLSQSPQTNHLKLLNLSNNPMYWEDCEPFQTLLQNVSGTLQHLEINHCLITDSIISSLIPAISQCIHLHVLGFASNPISMPMLIRVLQHLTPLKNLKYVIYPIPVHCYDQWHFQNSLNLRKLAIVRAQLKMMLEIAQRSDMNWITYSD